jgi:AAA domain
MPSERFVDSTLTQSVVVRRELLGSLDGGAGVTVLSAPAGSGKTVLLRSWIEEAGLRDRVAWVSVERDERDAQLFWLSAVRELRAAICKDAFIDRLDPAPKFDGEELVERLVAELSSMKQPGVFVIDDLHELRSPDALPQLELLLARRPPLLRFVLASRAVYAIAAGLLGALVAEPILHALSDHFLALAGIGMLTVFAAAAATEALQALFGIAGTGIALLALIILGNPATGVAFSRAMLPGFWHAIGFWLPPGAGVHAETSAVYFQGHATLGALFVLAVYAGVGAVVALVMGGRRRPA